MNIKTRAVALAAATAMLAAPDLADNFAAGGYLHGATVAATRDAANANTVKLQAAPAPVMVRRAHGSQLNKQLNFNTPTV